jgi:hypothetical protein
VIRCCVFGSAYTSLVGYIQLPEQQESIFLTASPLRYSYEHRTPNTTTFTFMITSRTVILFGGFLNNRKKNRSNSHNGRRATIQRYYHLRNSPTNTASPNLYTPLLADPTASDRLPSLLRISPNTMRHRNHRSRNGGRNNSVPSLQTNGSARKRALNHHARSA